MCSSDGNSGIVSVVVCDVVAELVLEVELVLGEELILQGVGTLLIGVGVGSGNGNGYAS